MTTLMKSPLLDLNLNGQHFRVTVIEEGSFIKRVHDDEERDDNAISSSSQFDEFQTKPPVYAGYLIDMIREIATLANFTYTFLPPSGFGSDCVLNLADENKVTGNSTILTEPYSSHFSKQYNCGSNDVNELQDTPYGTDMYLGMYYITAERMEKNWFTIPYEPPYKGTNGMMGTTTNIATVEELIVAQQHDNHPPLCMPGSTAALDFVQSLYPDLQIQPIYYRNDEELYRVIYSGKCPIVMFDAPIMAQFVYDRAHTINASTGINQCRDARGMPLGLIGDPLNAGLSHYGIGIGRHVNRSVVDTVSYWLNTMMIDGTLSRYYYKNGGGTGSECGYVLYPKNDRLMTASAIAGIVVASVLLFAVLPLFVWHHYRLKNQERRYKKRFVQQIARNIEIGPNPGGIAPAQLSEEVMHIAQGKQVISKEDLQKWMFDIKLDFISEEDFNALWNAMDINKKGEVDVVEFIVFLSACGPEFEEVYKEQMNLPKIEKLKLAARRLTNLSKDGEHGVRLNERRLDRSSRFLDPSAALRSSGKASRTGPLPLPVNEDSCNSC